MYMSTSEKCIQIQGLISSISWFIEMRATLGHHLIMEIRGVN